MHISRVFWVVILLLLAVAGIFFWLNRSKIETKEFMGSVVMVEGNSIIAKGTYTIDRKSIDAELVEVEVLTNDKTKITRESFKVPESGPFRPDDLPKEIRQVGLDQITSDLKITTVWLTVKSGHDIYKKRKFQAEEIIYLISDASN